MPSPSAFGTALALAPVLGPAPGRAEDWGGNRLGPGRWMCDGEVAALRPAVADAARAYSADLATRVRPPAIDPRRFEAALAHVQAVADEATMDPGRYDARRDRMRFEGQGADGEARTVELRGAAVRQLWRLLGPWDEATSPEPREVGGADVVVFWRRSSPVGAIFAAGEPGLAAFLDAQRDREARDAREDAEWADGRARAGTAPGPARAPAYPAGVDAVRLAAWRDWASGDGPNALARAAKREAQARGVEVEPVLNAREDEQRLLVMAGGDPRDAAWRGGPPLSRAQLLAAVPEGAFFSLAEGRPGAWVHLGTFRRERGDLWLWAGSAALPVGFLTLTDGQPRFVLLRDQAPWAEFARAWAAWSGHAPAPSVATLDPGFADAIAVSDAARAGAALPRVAGALRLRNLRTGAWAELDATTLGAVAPEGLDPTQGAWLAADGRGGWTATYRLAPDREWLREGATLAPLGHLGGRVVLLAVGARPASRAPTPCDAWLVLPDQ